jgi:integrase
MVTRPLPGGAKIVTRDGKRVAEWIDGSGKKRRAPVNGPRAKRPGIQERATTYTAQYRDGNGVVRRVPTECKSLAAARAVLSDLESRAEKVKSGVVTQAEADVAEHADTAIVEHIDAYVAALACKRGKGARVKVSPQHVENVNRTLRAAVQECGFKRLRDLRREAVERWVARLIDLPAEAVLDDGGSLVAAARPSARTINAKLVILTAWGNWLVRSQRLATNPFERLRAEVGLDEEDDVRRCRRALTAEELGRLVTVARLRPVAEYGRDTIRVVDAARPAKSRATWQKTGLTLANIGAAADRGRGRLRPDVLERLEQVGRERALLYAVLCTTGLRKGELAALTVADVLLDQPQPVIELPGSEAKNGKRASLPLRADVAAELQAWIEAKTEALYRPGAGVVALPRPVGVVPLFDVPSGLIRILNRDLQAAGIPKRDDRGRTVDVHAMRGTFGSLLAAAGTSPIVLKELMRHRRIETTLKHYVDPRLLDVAGAVSALPAIGFAGGAAAAIDGESESGALNGAPNAAHGCKSQEIADQMQAAALVGATAKRSRIRQVSRVFPAKEQKRAKGLEPSTSSLGSSVPIVLQAGNIAFSGVAADGCTGGCTETAGQAEIIARAVELVAALNLSLTESVAVLRHLSAGAGRLHRCGGHGHADGGQPAVKRVAARPDEPTCC